MGSCYSPDQRACSRARSRQSRCGGGPMCPPAAAVLDQDQCSRPPLALMVAQRRGAPVLTNNYIRWFSDRPARRRRACRRQDRLAGRTVLGSVVARGCRPQWLCHHGRRLSRCAVAAPASRTSFIGFSTVSTRARSSSCAKRAAKAREIVYKAMDTARAPRTDRGGVSAA